MSGVIGIDFSNIDEAIRRELIVKKYSGNTLIALCVIFDDIDLSSSENDKDRIEFVKKLLPLKMELYFLQKKPDFQLAENIKKAFAEIIGKIFSNCHNTT